MNENFEKALEFVLRWEAYRSDRPDDPGGLTIFGISARFYPDEVAKMDKLPKEQALDIAMEIYRRYYWEKAGCDSLEWPMCLLVMDTAVNMGVEAANSLMKRSDGFADFVVNRIDYYVRLKGQVMEGWINRVIDLYKTCKSAHPITTEYQR